MTIHQESTLEFLKRKKCKDNMKQLFWQFLQLHLATKPCYFFPSANNQRRYECSTTLSDCVLIPIFHLLLFQTLCFCCRSPASSRPLPALSADPSCGSAIVSHSASTTDAEQAHWRESIKIPARVDFFCKRNSNANASGDGTCFIITFIAMNHKYFMSPQSISTS